MIRRTVGDEFVLITQHDHALLSGELAEFYGNDDFARPLPYDKAILGIRLHDCGWTLHDDEPTLNSDNLPLDVFETPHHIALKVWTASVEKAERKDPYAGLLVSLHVLALCVSASTNERALGAGFDMDDPKQRFAIIKFQQREIERQETLRAMLGLRTDRPGHKTPPKTGAQIEENRLKFNLRLLQALDQMSLAACCTDVPMTPTVEVPTQPSSGRSVHFDLKRDGNDLLVNPWPFSQNEIELFIPACRVPASLYKDESEFRAVYQQGCGEVLHCRVRPASSR